jgi:DNA adenine methylase
MYSIKGGKDGFTIKKTKAKPAIDFLAKAKQFAKDAGYPDWDDLILTKKPYKLELNGVKFGRQPYTDYITNLLNNAPDAEVKRKSYLARATKIKGDWKDDKYSPNNLAIKILWGGADDGTDGESTEGTDDDTEITEGAARPFFGRMGGKRLLVKRLIPMFPTDIETFVEPFVGAGNIFWRLDHKPEIKYVINDFDESVVKIFKSLKNGDKCLETAGTHISREEFKRLKNKTGRTACDEITILRNSFFSQGTSYQEPKNRISKPYAKERLEEAQEILKNTTILNQSFEKVIEKYDDKTTFFYLDPPYENPNQNDYKDYVTPEQVYDAVKNIKGRFLLSYNDSSKIRNIFKEFNIKTIKTVYGKTQHIGERTVNELIITNYTIGKDLQGGDLTQEITNAFLYGIAYPTFNPSRDNVFNFQPNALLPAPKDMLDMTIQSYKDPAQSVSNYQLVLDKPTYKFYAKESVLIIAVRGTQEFRDVKAWLPVARGDVINTERVSTDLREIQADILNYKDYTIFGTGHSLAGVILDKLLDRKIILQSVSFNPAVEKGDLLNTENLRYYLEQDPLFNIMGHFANNTIVLDRPQNLWVRLLKIITPSTASINPATDHFIDKFKPHMPDNYPQELSGGGIKLEADIAAKGGEKVDETIQNKLEQIVTEPMDGGDIAHYYPKVRIIKYNDLDNYTSIEELLPSDDTYFILLYLDSPSSGHWVTLVRNKNLITFFDSYGGKIDSQLKWVDMGERIRLDTDKPCLTRLLKAGSIPYTYSPYDYQADNPDIATCGSHCLNFITCTLDKGMSVGTYRTHMERIRERTGLDFDEIVAMNFPVR